jgi:hypothetical protein
MFIETYYDETKAAPTSTGEPPMPYPELVGGELALWQSYLPIKRGIGRVYKWFEFTAPEPIVTEVKKVRQTGLFDRMEIWSRRDPDPMVVGLTFPNGAKTRYYSIARWGDAKITLEEVKRKLRLQKWAQMIGCAFTLAVVVILFLTAHG